MVRRRDLLATLGTAVGLAGCTTPTTPTTDPLPTMTVHLRNPSRTDVSDGWETTVDVRTEVTGGVGEFPMVREPRVTVFDADRSPLDSVHLPVYASHDQQNRVTPPTGTPPTATATPSGTERSTETSQEPARPTEAYRQRAVPADTTVETTTATAPAWVGIEFADASGVVSVDLAKYTGDESLSADWTISTHEYAGSAFRAPPES